MWARGGNGSWSGRSGAFWTDVYRALLRRAVWKCCLYRDGENFSRYRCVRVVESVIYRLQEYARCVRVSPQCGCIQHFKIASRGGRRTFKETLVLASFASSLLFVRRKFLHGVAR